VGLESVFAEFAPLLPPGTKLAGPDQADHSSAPPRITWEPVSAKHGLPKRIGGGPGRDGDLWERDVRLNVKIWGKTLAQTEELLGAFVNAAHYLLSQHSYALDGETWHTGGETASGVVCLLAFSLKVPIARTKKPTRPLEAVAVTAKLNDETV